MRPCCIYVLLLAGVILTNFTCIPTSPNTSVNTPATQPGAQQPASGPSRVSDDDANAVELVFSLELNRSVYRDSDFGDPPQLALWLESAAGDIVHTVYVSRSTGKGLWIGKIECPVSLPYWVSRYNRETNTQGPPTFQKPVHDAITGATPATTLTKRLRVPAGSRWNYFLEINVSGDFNAEFQRIRADGLPDPQENGQPSLIYRGEITAAPDATSQPELIGHTDQWEPIDQIIPDLSGVTSAKNLLTALTVNVK